MNTRGGMFGGGLGSFLGSLFGGDPGDIYRQAGDAARPWFDRAAGAYDPYTQAGQRAIPGYEDWLNRMKDPSGFINNMMGGYQESPWARNLKDQAMRGGMNAASASGMLGSTPFANEMQQQAGQISSQDMQDWLGRVLGINTQYGAGMGGLMGQGLNAAGGQANIFGQRGNMEGWLTGGEEAANQQRWNNMFGGIGNMIGSFF